MAVDVNKIKCNFVNEVIKYITCGKYSIDCCSTKALRAWMNYKLSIFTDCEVSAEDTCYLSELDLNNYLLSCSDAVSTLDCDTQISLELSKLIESCTITSVLANPNDGSQYPVITVSDDSSYPVASIDVVTTSSCGGSETFTVESGSFLIAGVPSIDEEYNPHVRVSITIPNVVTNTAGYIGSLWLYETINSSTLNTVKIEINADPTSSPYLSCGGCTTVNSVELYFGHPNYTVALTNLIRNAMLVLYGDADLGDFRVEAIGNGYRISSLAKHNPATTWVGFSKLQSYIEYSPSGGAQIKTPTTSCLLTEYSSLMQIKHVMPLVDCSSIDLIVSGIAGMTINWGLTNMHQIILANTNGSSPLVFEGIHNAVCPKTTLTATVVALDNISTKEWRDPGNTFISSDLSIVVEDTGTYTFNIELDNGCSASDTITV
jgi:hypothetical protein